MDWPLPSGGDTSKAMMEDPLNNGKAQATKASSDFSQQALGEVKAELRGVISSPAGIPHPTRVHRRFTGVSPGLASGETQESVHVEPKGPEIGQGSRSPPAAPACPAQVLFVTPAEGP